MREESAAPPQFYKKVIERRLNRQHIAALKETKETWHKESEPRKAQFSQASAASQAGLGVHGISGYLGMTQVPNPEDQDKVYETHVLIHWLQRLGTPLDDLASLRLNFVNSGGTVFQFRCFTGLSERYIKALDRYIVSRVGEVSFYPKTANGLPIPQPWAQEYRDGLRDATAVIKQAIRTGKIPPQKCQNWSSRGGSQKEVIAA
jgi:hypothetical protein